MEGDETIINMGNGLTYQMPPDGAYKPLALDSTGASPATIYTYPSSSPYYTTSSPTYIPTPSYNGIYDNSDERYADIKIIQEMIGKLAEKIDDQRKAKEKKEDNKKFDSKGIFLGLKNGIKYLVKGKWKKEMEPSLKYNKAKNTWELLVENGTIALNVKMKDKSWKVLA